MYKSPIEIIQGQMQYQMDDNIYRAVLKYDINVDKEELLRALKYDRGQYEAGYRDGELEAIKHGRCPVCNGKKSALRDYFAGVSIEIETERKEMSVWLGDECIALIPIDYCPSCGAKMDAE